MVDSLSTIQKTVNTSLMSSCKIKNTGNDTTSIMR